MLTKFTATWRIMICLTVFLGLFNVAHAQDATSVQETAVATDLLAQLDAPLLFVKRHSYSGIHIYDTCYKWPPSGGGFP